MTADRPDRPPDERRPDWRGDGHDPVRLLTAKEVAEILRVPRKSVYALPIRRVRVGSNTVRWRPKDVQEFIDRRTEAP